MRYITNTLEGGAQYTNSINQHTVYIVVMFIAIIILLLYNWYPLGTLKTSPLYICKVIHSLGSYISCEFIIVGFSLKISFSPLVSVCVNLCSL